ncbi:peptidase M24 [Arthrobacter sp. RIT-PI-e]|uniref:M24 family metallopeptidase n=1 Tax=Arthrobacter sp. RIT-PI-e TaxID=1681197 RepID=UPI0006760D21|nr:M24 family metallopeptidase [Arthrobacter sp. RIT-PI-e]KNC18803.1 peptidase M24 [Arthrobacter sp. RIT-PI-e]
MCDGLLIPPRTAEHTPSSPDAAHERSVKRGRVLELLDRAGRDSLLLTSTTALTWYLGGSRVHVSLAGDPVAALLVTRDGDHVVTFSNEAERLVAEELPDDVVLHQVPWYGSLQDVGAWYGPDASPMAEGEVARELREARRSLLPVELARYEVLNADAARALTDVLGEATPQTTEREIAAALAARLVAVGADPLVLLCSGSDRADFRHPLPTGGVLGRRAMAVVCARRHGLIANVTRWVRFGAATAAEQDAESRILAVEQDVLAATVPGASLGGILTEIGAAYERHGFGADQWRQHHQGGPAGYAGRDPRATPAAEDTVAEYQAFTWNPSAPAVKVEDTVLLEPSGPRVLSVDPRWPVTRVGALDRPAVLQL